MWLARLCTPMYALCTLLVCFVFIVSCFFLEFLCYLRPFMFILMLTCMGPWLQQLLQQLAPACCDVSALQSLLPVKSFTYQCV